MGPHERAASSFLADDDDYSDTQLVWVENGSSDGTPAEIRRRCRLGDLTQALGPSARAQNRVPATTSVY